MPVPASNLIQFAPTGTARLYVDYVTDPNGPPPTVLDADAGFDVGGKVTIPNWIDGRGHVVIYATEFGGPLNKEVGRAEFDVTKTVGEPRLKTYEWIVKIAAGVFPDPQSGASQVYQLDAVFTLGDQSSDIATFVEMGTYMVN